MNDLREIEDRLRDATRAYAVAVEPAPDAWERLAGRTSAASRRRRAVWIGATAAVAAAAVFAGALLLGDDPTRRVRTPPVATTPTKSDLKHLLLTLPEMPPNFMLYGGSNLDDISAVCGHDVDAVLARQQVGRADIKFVRENSGEFTTGFFESLASYGDADQAAAVMTKLKAIYAGCTKFDRNDKVGTVTHWQLTGMSFANIGDDRLAYGMGGTFAGHGTGTKAANQVFVRHGQVIVATTSVSVVTYSGGGHVSKSDFVTSTLKANTKVTTSTSVSDQTRRLSHILFADLPSSYGQTSVDSSTPGVIKITGLFVGSASRLVQESQLATAGTESGLWTAADAARMMQTQPHDGIVRSDNGETTWTYQDGALQIVAPLP